MSDGFEQIDKMLFDPSSEIIRLGDVVQDAVDAALGEQLADSAIRQILYSEAAYLATISSGDRLTVLDGSGQATNGIALEQPAVISDRFTLLASVQYVIEDRTDIQVFTQRLDELAGFRLHPSFGWMTFWQFRQRIAVGDDLLSFADWMNRHGHMPMSYSNQPVQWPGFGAFRNLDDYGCTYLAG